MKNILLLQCFFLLTSIAYSQAELKFDRYTTEHGLINDDVTAICQDHLGFIWVGTKSGCSRFDGIEFRTYQQNENKSNSIIPASTINKIICDKQNGVWFALAGQSETLLKYDYESDDFIDYSTYIKKILHINRYTIFPVWNVYSDNESNLWITTSEKETFCYDTKKKQIVILKNSQNKIVTIPFTRSLFEDNDNNIWFVTCEGIYIYNKKENILRHYQNDPQNPHSISSNNCNCIYQDSEGQIWIGTYNGLNRLKSFSTTKDTAFFERYMNNPHNIYSLSNNLVYDITEYDSNNILIGTVDGLCMLDKNTEKIYRYMNDEVDDESINSNLIRCLLRDNHGNIWVGTAAGVGKLQTKNFKSYMQSTYINSISHSKVQAIRESPDSKVWIATPKGIDVFDRNTGRFRFLVGITFNDEGLYAAPVALYSHDQKMWIGTWGGGISNYDYNRNNIENYVNKNDFMDIDNVSSVFIDSKNILWVGAVSVGIYSYNRETGDKKKFSNNSKVRNSLSSNHVTTIIEDSESKIWVGTFNGLNKLTDRENGTFNHYLDGLQIHCITESSDKNLWVGTNKGLYCYDKTKNQIQKADYNNEFSQINILGILEDNNNYLWISTSSGLVKFIPNRNATPEIVFYRREEGLKQGYFLPNAYVKLSDGTMVFGGNKGFCIFNPEKIVDDTLTPYIVFTNLKVANTSVRAKQIINNQEILQKSICLTKQLVFNYKNNNFAIEFAGLQYNMSQYNKYAYRLDGHDLPGADWHCTDDGDREVEYMNIPAGDYVFRVKAANSYGIWTNEEAQLKITILPPWWRTNWFTLIWIMSLIGSILLFVKFRIFRLQEQKQKLEKIVKQRTKQLQEININLEKGKDEIEQQAQKMSELNVELLKTNENLELKTIEVEKMANKIHETDQKQLQFFANISHEFRTPLALIIGPLENCLQIELSDDWNKINTVNHLKLMLRNTKRLQRLANEIIDFRKINIGKKKIQNINNNVEKFIEEVIGVFSGMAEAKNIQITFNNEKFEVGNKNLIHNFRFDPDVMEKIFYNLISNAIKYTSDGGRVSIELEIEDELLNIDQNNFQLKNNNPQLIIKISDTGIGIKEENIDKIFDRFYRVDSDESYSKDGSGIGLAYTKELVKLLSGNISVISEYGYGTTFILLFPLIQVSETELDNYSSEIAIHNAINLNFTKSMVEEKLTAISCEEQLSIKDILIRKELKEKAKKILIVEDNFDLRNFIKTELEALYYIIEAENGERALEIIDEEVPELVISDIMMPIMDGINLCKRIKADENTCHIPIILLTAKTEDENMIKGLETGADDYVTKPFNMSMLKIKISNIFKSRQILKDKFKKSINIIPSEITHSKADEKFIQKAIDIIKENIDNPDFDNDTFVSYMNVSRTLVYKKIKSIAGQSVSEFIRSIRLKEAAKLFIEGNTNISEVCYSIGFKYPNIFSRYFNEMFGCTPTQFIKDNRSLESY